MRFVIEEISPHNANPHKSQSGAPENPILNPFGTKSAWISRMRTRNALTILACVFLLATPSIDVLGEDSGWDVVAPGIDFKTFYLSDPNHVFVARMDRSNPNVAVESSIAQGRLARGFESVSGMAGRYDQAINYWGQSWGSRNNVVVAINGMFYDIQTGVPRSGQIQSGWYAKRFDNVSGESGFAWTLNGGAFIGRCVTHPPQKQLIQKISTGESFTFDGINIPRPSDKTILYTPQYDDHTYTDENGLEVLIEVTRPTVVIPTPYYARGIVREVRNNLSSSAIPFDHIVLSAHGTAIEALSILEVGDEIGVSQEITHFEQGCQPPTFLEWTKTYSSIGGSFNFLRAGTIIDFNDPGALERNPRTAIAYNSEYVFFIVVDGRHEGISLGMTIHELAEFTKNTLGATDGINQDGGGSSTMVVNGEVVNVPNAELLTHRVYLPLAMQDQTSKPGIGMSMETLLSEASPQQSIQGIGLERWVSNGMLMVVVEPMQSSSLFSPNDAIETQVSTALRLGPGTNYAVVTIIPAGTDGVILNHFNQLDGVLAKGSFWWKVSLAGNTGWVTEETIDFSGN
jgi:hypothetical protein